MSYKGRRVLILDAASTVAASVTTLTAAMRAAEDIARPARPAPAILIDEIVLAEPQRFDFGFLEPKIERQRDHTAPRSPIRSFKKSSKR